MSQSMSDTLLTIHCIAKFGYFHYVVSL